MTENLAPAIELSKWIEALRFELEVALGEGKDKQVRFEVEKLELELKVSAKSDVNAKGGVRFKVWGLVDVSAEGGGKLEREAAQTVKLTLKARHRDGGSLLVSDVEEHPGKRAETPRK